MATPAAPGLPLQTPRPTQRQARPRARQLCWNSCRSTGPGCFNRSTADAGPTCGSTWRPWSVSWVNCWSRPSGGSARAEPSPNEAPQLQTSERDLVLAVLQIRHQGRRVPGGRLGGYGSWGCGRWGTACRWCRGRAASGSGGCGGAGLSTSRGRQRVHRCRRGDVHPCSASSRSRAERMQAGQGQLGALLLHPVLAGDRIHAQSTLQHLHLQQAMVHRPGRRQGATS